MAILTAIAIRRRIIGSPQGYPQVRMAGRHRLSSTATSVWRAAAGLPVPAGPEPLAPPPPATGRCRVHPQNPAGRRQARANASPTPMCTHDGRLTREQAQAGMPMVARNFATIDVEHKGYVTLPEIRTFAAERRVRGQTHRCRAALQLQAARLTRVTLRPGLDPREFLHGSHVPIWRPRSRQGQAQVQRLGREHQDNRLCRSDRRRGAHRRL